MIKTNYKTQDLSALVSDWSSYYKFNINSLVRKFTEEPPEYFEKQGKLMAFNLFHAMSKRVPAYANFLETRGFRPERVKSLDDLQYIPWTDKVNYLKKYSLDKLSWDGRLSAPIISASSATSGVPTFWPRSLEIEIETTYIFELFLRYFFCIDQYQTLHVSGFAMGIYVGGTFTLNTSMRLYNKGYPLTIMTPGINIPEIINSIKDVGKYYKQIIIGGYPPLVRDVLCECEKQGIDLKSKKIKLFFASESISEEFRQYLYSKVGILETDYLHSSMNLYGTADAAIAGHETPLSILTRKLFSKDERYCKIFFKSTHVPSLNQYYPFFKFFETIDQEIVFSSKNNHVPLMRYNIHDRGGILSYNNVIDVVKSFNYSYEDIENLVHRDLLWRLPYVYLYGRTDHSVKLSGALIEMETIRKALEDASLREFITGKFTMIVRLDGEKKQSLEINIELKPKQRESGTLFHQIETVVVDRLLKENIEYRAIYASAPKQQTPRIIFWRYEDPSYFQPGTKHKWSRVVE